MNTNFDRWLLTPAGQLLVRQMELDNKSENQRSEDRKRAINAKIAKQQLYRAYGRKHDAAR